MSDTTSNLIVVLGPTASGKTRLGVILARALDGEIVSADSRQVYRGLDIGSGKDLQEYECDGVSIPHHLIDCADLTEEYSVFSFQRDFLRVHADIRARKRIPVLVGGTGLYLEAALAKEQMLEVPENPDLRNALSKLNDDALRSALRDLKPGLHNTTDLVDRERIVRAIEIAHYVRDHPPAPMPDIRPFILGTRWDRTTLRHRIAQRLRERLDAGLIEEVEGLLRAGVSPEKLHFLGLEYRFVNEFLEGHIRNRNDLFQKLNAAIAQFAKRQDTWFRRMERQGCTIHWVDEADPARAFAILRSATSTAGARTP